MCKKILLDIRLAGYRPVPVQSVSGRCIPRHYAGHHKYGTVKKLVPVTVGIFVKVLVLYYLDNKNNCSAYTLEKLIIRAFFVFPPWSGYTLHVSPL